MAETIVELLTSLVKPIVEDLQLELVEVQYRQEQHGWVIRIIIYAEGGITIEHCQGVSREVSYLLDVEDFITRKYHLEVTSPGLDRPLTTPRDFERNIDKKVTVTLVEGTEVLTITATIKKVDDEDITVTTDNEEITFHYSEVKKAKLVIDFSKSGKVKT
jgi:ribosome maturation factor RimP